MGKYGEALGIWDLMIGRTKEQGALQLHPTHKDCRKLLNIITGAKAETDKSYLMDQISIFIKDLIRKEYPPENEAEKEELEAYVDCNLIELMNELLITFRFAKKEDLDAQKESLKKGMLPQGLRVVTN